MSGVAFNSWTFAPPSNWAERLAKYMGWAGRNEAEMLEFFESCDSFDMIKAQSNIFTKEEKYGLHVLFSFSPVIEPYTSENCFIPKSPILMSREAWSKEIDCIIGATSFEGLINGFIEKYDIDEHLKVAKENVAYFAPLTDLKINANSEEAKNYGRKIKSIYFGDEEFTTENVEKYYHVIIKLFL